MENYGRHRQSIADIEEGLHRIFNGHPKSHINDQGEPVIPADALVDVLFSFSDAFNGVPLLSDEEQTMLESLLAANPGLEVTPEILLKFIAQKTAASPSPPESPEYTDMQLPDRGRSDDRDTDHGRSSSNESNSAYYRGSSRPSSRGPPQTPNSSKSGFDSERRQRSTPLVAAPPSSWSKRPPAHRRKSDAGNRSDSESGPPSSFAGSCSGGRVRAPSNPVSPSSSALDLNSFSPNTSPSPHSRPPSRQSSQSGGFGAMRFPEDHGYSSPEETIHRRRLSFGSSGGFNTVPLPRTSTDSDDEDSIANMIAGPRSFLASDASMDDFARLEALTRQNEDLKNKRLEYEEFMTRKVAEHEHDYAELQAALDQLRMELSATKREEKELRSKERQNTKQISALEQDVAKMSASITSSKINFQSLQKTYAEQCTTSEKYRNDLRDKEEQLRALTEQYALSEIEREKLEKERISYEERIALLEADLNVAQNTFAELEIQKHENMMLKETIDRMRFDIDELRNAATAATAGSGQSSAANTISKSLGVELAGKMDWEGQGDSFESESSTETVIEEDDDTEGEEEDVIQTIITRKKRKVASRAMVEAYHQRAFEEAKDYSDMGIQYDPTYFAVSRSSQTEEAPKILTVSFSTQTEEMEPVFVERAQAETCEMEIQTDVQDEELSRSPSPQHMESLASSSSTVLPPTPKAMPRQLEEVPIPVDQPPAYNQITHDHNWSIVADVLKKWHEGAKMPVEPVEGGVSQEAVEEWKALKEELGVGCLVIDKIVESSEKTPRIPANGKGKGSSRNRFYNIYNTYVFGGDKGAVVGSILGQAMMVVGASALVILAVSPYIAPHYAVPGGATYYDRAAWNSFNSLHAAGEGFAGPDGTAVVWDFLGRVGGGAARMARGWPT